MADYSATINHAAQRYHIDPRVLTALLKQESGLTMGKTSTAGAQDIAQFMPATAKAYGVTLGDGRAADDIMGAAHYLSDNLRRTHGDIRGALSIYNSGSPTAYKDPNFSQGQTYNYVKSILGMVGGADALNGPKPADSPAASYQSINVPGATDQDARKTALLTWLQDRGKPGALGSLLQGLKAAQTPASSQIVSAPGGQPADNAPTHEGMSKLLELFWEGQNGIDYNSRSGMLADGSIGGHSDHVHVAAGPKTVVALGKLAQQMGLNVGENSHFNGGQRVTGGHADNSYHYKDEAIDVSGDPTAMRKYAAMVAHKYGLKVNG